jgi:diguanylate cyclase (GGDEF)-like protein
MDIPIFVLTAKDISMEDRYRLAGKITKCMRKSYFTKEDLLMHIRDLEAMYPVRAGLLDEVSGLFDHSYFQIRLGQEVARARRYKNTFTLLLIDLDGFTDYMKINGIRQSNLCIKKIAEFIRKSTRGSDIVVRYGVDEFAVLLGNTVKEMTEVVASRVLSYIDNYPFFGEELTQRGKLTASISIINCPKDATAPEEILAKAHVLMRNAKESGGNRIKAYEHETQS